MTEIKIGIVAADDDSAVDHLTVIRQMMLDGLTSSGRLNAAGYTTSDMDGNSMVDVIYHGEPE
jgi:hypothetical protein